MCDFCNKIEHLKYVGSEFYSERYKNQIVKDREKFHIWYNGNSDRFSAGTHLRNIKFCPMCGRNLAVPIGLKDDEILFFKVCYLCKVTLDLSIRDIINLCSETIPPKRYHYLLRKWSGLGFYEYGVTLDLGWFHDYYPNCVVYPNRYQTLVDQVISFESLKEEAL